MTVSKDTNDEVDIFDFASLYLFGSQHTNEHAFREGRKERDLTFNTLWNEHAMCLQRRPPPPSTAT